MPSLQIAEPTARESVFLGVEGGGGSKFSMFTLDNKISIFQPLRVFGLPLNDE